LAVDPVTGDLIVSLFSGSVMGESGGEGTELRKRAGKLIRFDPDRAQVTDFVTGLTAPTDLLILEDAVYELEYCSDFLDPDQDRAQMKEKPLHGGFRRFSGRLHRVARDTGEVLVVADGLDGPTNLALIGDRVFVAQGMGTPGRPIPGPKGTVPLEGFIEALPLAE
jgi:hypothetical protein